MLSIYPLFNFSSHKQWFRFILGWVKQVFFFLHRNFGEQVLKQKKRHPSHNYKIRLHIVEHLLMFMLANCAKKRIWFQLTVPIKLLTQITKKKKGRPPLKSFSNWTIEHLSYSLYNPPSDVPLFNRALLLWVTVAFGWCLTEKQWKGSGRDRIASTACTSLLWNLHDPPGRPIDSSGEWQAACQHAVI